jgi:hypothetical protein
MNNSQNHSPGAAHAADHRAAMARSAIPVARLRYQGGGIHPASAKHKRLPARRLKPAGKALPAKKATSKKGRPK